MQQPEPAKPITYFAVPPDVFTAVVTYLTTKPYNEVSTLLAKLQSDSKARFDEMIPLQAGLGGKIVGDVPEPDIDIALDNTEAQAEETKPDVAKTEKGAL